MIQFNLLPDVKLDFIRSQAKKRAVLVIASLASIGAVSLLVLMYFTVNVVQKGHMDNLENDINAGISDLQSNEDLNKILTIQNQLNNLSGVHEKKPKASRLGDFLPQLRPSEVPELSYGEIEVDFILGTIKIEGKVSKEEDALKSVNVLIDKMKFARFSIDKVVQPDVYAFTEVKLEDIKREKDNAVYTITAKFDPILFDNTKDVKLEIEELITTRSLLGRPLFEKLPEPEEEVPAEDTPADPALEEETQ